MCFYRRSRVRQCVLALRAAAALHAAVCAGAVQDLADRRRARQPGKTQDRCRCVSAVFAAKAASFLAALQIGLVSNIATGVFDFFYEPGAAILHDPSTVIDGVAKGKTSRRGSTFLF